MTAQADASLIEELQGRGLIAQMSGAGELISHLAGASRTLYCGFDPTADSLHLGHLVPLLVLKRFQLAGHKPIALVGGATGLIGDPSFKDAERQLHTPDIVEGWAERIRQQVSAFLDFDCGVNSAIVVNNLEWTANMPALTFLRDIGKHFSINNMIHKESVKQRIDREGEGISFTEFSYALLQAMDFAELNQRYQCTLQVGGSDQWGNIVGGIELCRRHNQQHVYGLTVPLITKADGTKFGKTESGAVWLDPAKTSPYSFYQFWLNTADADVYQFLGFFTFLSVAEIEAIRVTDTEHKGRPEAQRILAREATRLVHGDGGLAGAERITEALFSGSVNQLEAADFEQLRMDGLPCSSITPDRVGEMPLTTLLTESGMARAAREVKDALARSAVMVNGEFKSLEDNMNTDRIFARDRSFHGRFFLVRLGKKKYHLFELQSG